MMRAECKLAQVRRSDFGILAGYVTPYIRIRIVVGREVVMVLTEWNQFGGGSTAVLQVVCAGS